MKDTKTNLFERGLQLTLLSACLALPQIVTAQSVDTTPVKATTVNSVQVKNKEQNSKSILVYLNQTPTVQPQNQKPFVMQQGVLDRGISRLGGADSGGGDEVGLSFQQAVQSAAVKLSATMDNKTKALLMSTIVSSKYVVVDQTLKVKINGETQESVAINVPKDKIIYVNRARWTSLRDQLQREKIGGHEVLSLMGLESTGDYHVSGQFLNSICDEECSKYPASFGLDILSVKKAWAIGTQINSSELNGQWLLTATIKDRTVEKGYDGLFNDQAYNPNGVSDASILRFRETQDPLSNRAGTSCEFLDKQTKEVLRGPSKVDFNSADNTASFSMIPELDYVRIYNCREVNGKPGKMLCQNSYDGNFIRYEKINNVTVGFSLYEKIK